MPLLFESNAHIQGCVWAHPLLLEQNKKGMHACKCFAFNVKGGGEEGEKKRILQKNWSGGKQLNFAVRMQIWAIPRSLAAGDWGCTELRWQSCILHNCYTCLFAAQASKASCTSRNKDTLAISWINSGIFWMEAFNSEEPWFKKALEQVCLMQNN